MDETNKTLLLKLEKYEKMKNNQSKASKNYYERNKVDLNKKKIKQINDLKNDPEKYKEYQIKKRIYYQNQKLKNPEYLKKQYQRRKELQNYIPLELSLEL